MTGDGVPNAGLAIGKGEVSRGLVWATAGWSLFVKFSLAWLYLCCQEREFDYLNSVGAV